jgi:hypothetical protein
VSDVEAPCVSDVDYASPLSDFSPTVKAIVTNNVYETRTRVFETRTFRNSLLQRVYDRNFRLTRQQ